jgi:hypothetical protein
MFNKLNASVDAENKLVLHVLIFQLTFMALQKNKKTTKIHISVLAHDRKLIC